MVGPWQIVIIAVVILVLFGASRLGEMGKGLGEGIRNFKKGISDDEGPKELDEAPVKAEATVESEKAHKEKEEA
jgi:sec-independent protein translocase protein TatA